jgi:bifunctional N-acetylglucosamine-1-phosphate-uridyltransferase/glucosamine-1-phosphate-acetyltransferase GlmU-like protein
MSLPQVRTKHVHGKNAGDVKIYAFVNLYGCEIGDDSKIGAFVEIQKAPGSAAA